jgi:hypothetical protein
MAIKGMMVPLFSISFLLGFLALFPSAGMAKKLVLFAGPHKAASVSVDLFFHDHASTYPNTYYAEGLDGWKWPTATQELWIDEDHRMPTSDVLNALVTQADNATAQLIIREAIQKAWDTSRYGIIVGTAEFDRVGNTPYTHYNGLEAMKGVIQQLQVPTEDIVVVLNYRVPRRDQWISMWKHADGDDHYKKFICKSDTRELEEDLETSMNPLKLAVAYRQEGWNVVLIDMGGVAAMGRDISHVIACDILENTVCQGGLVIPIMQTYNANSGGDKGLNSLPDRDQRDMDQLFRERDCYYQPILSNDPGFKILFKDTIWQGCLKGDGEKTQQQIYEPLLDSDFLLGALKEQKSCSWGGPKMKNILVGNYESMVVSTIGKNNDEVGEQGIISNEGDASGQEQGSTMEATPQESEGNPAPTKHRSRFLSFLLFTAVGYGVYQLYVRRRNGGRDIRFSQVNFQDPDQYPSQELKVMSARDLINRAKLANHAEEPSYWTDPPQPSYSDGQPSYTDGDII